MIQTRFAVGLAALFFAWGGPVGAQVPDHLKCYKVKDPQAKASYTADLGGLVPEPGCVIKVPAKLACVPSTKTISGPPFPPGGGGTGIPNAFGCYKVKCPKAALPQFALNDQFGARLVTVSASKLLCAPVAPPTATTTATTTTITTTTAVPMDCSCVCVMGATPCTSNTICLLPGGCNQASCAANCAANCATNHPGCTGTGMCVVCP